MRIRPPQHKHLTVVKLSGSEGADIWRRRLAGAKPDNFSTNAMTTTDGGDILAAGGTLADHSLGPAPVNITVQGSSSRDMARSSRSRVFRSRRR